MRLRRTRETWHRDIALSTGRTVELEWKPFGRIAVGNETLIDAPAGIVRVKGKLTSGEAWEIRERLTKDDYFTRTQETP